MVGLLLRVGLPVLVMMSGLSASQDTSRADAARMGKKLTAIVDRGIQPPGQKPSPLRTGFTDREVNAYFKVSGPEFLPVGVVSPELTIDAGGKVSARATVDLDAALKPGRFNPLSLLGKTTEVTAVGVVSTADGMGVLQLEKATLAGISVPKTLLQQLVSYYTRTPESPQGFDLDKPFPLPSNIRTVETARGQAVIVQP